MSSTGTKAVQAERLRRAKSLADDVAVRFRFQGLLADLESLAIERGIDPDTMDRLLTENGGKSFAGAYREWVQA